MPNSADSHTTAGEQFTVGGVTFPGSFTHLSGVTKLGIYDHVTDKWTDGQLETADIICDGTVENGTQTNAGASPDSPHQHDPRPEQVSSACSHATFDSAWVRPQIIRATYDPTGTWGTSEDLLGKETLHPRLKSTDEGPPGDGYHSSSRADFAFTSAGDGPRFVIPFVERYCGEDKDHLPVYKREGLDAIARELGVSTGFSSAIVKSKCGEWERLWA